MFGWYRRSTLIIVYLAGVCGSGSYAASEWFRRGWTLQELLASRTILFYTRSWTLCKNLESPVLCWKSLKGRLAGTLVSPRALTMHAQDTSGHRHVVLPASRILPIRFWRFSISTYQISTGNPLRTRWAAFSQKSYLGLGIFRFRIGSGSRHHFTAVSQPARRATTDSDSPSCAVQSIAKALWLTRQIISSLPWFINRRLILPCLSYRVGVVLLRSSDTTLPSYTYNILVSGLRPLEITLPEELENAIALPDALQLVRPWHSESLGGSTMPDTTATEQLLETLGQ
ncbi:hypothetical protein F5141DRAFT_108657 [Pisolithus sp. B1]|nr:hypothetical protein F5141DRAFT_108657 [Pisolithus sp. B1]